MRDGSSREGRLSRKQCIYVSSNFPTYTQLETPCSVVVYIVDNTKVKAYPILSFGSLSFPAISVAEKNKQQAPNQRKKEDCKKKV